MKKFFQKILAPLKRFLDRFTREPKHLDYDANAKTEKGVLTPEAEAARKQILRTELHEGDSYRLGPNARVFVGPPGRAGKAWIKKRTEANAAARKKRFDEMWEKKRARCIEIMMMSEEQLKASGIWDEVQMFLKENREAKEALEAAGLKFDRPKEETKSEPLPPASTTTEAFREILATSPDMKTELAAVGQAVFTPSEKSAMLQEYEGANSLSKDAGSKG